MRKLFFSVCILYVVLQAIPAAEPVNPALQREFVMTASVHAYDLDPHTANYSHEAQILTALYEGLFSYDPQTLEPVPALAESWQISRDKLRWTITIRKTAAFSNNQPITAHTIRDSWLALLDPATEAPFASLLDCISGAAAYRKGQANADAIGIKVRDDHTLLITLVSPTEHLSKILCHHAFSAVSTEKNVYSGPYILEKSDASGLLLKKNAAYRDAAQVAVPSIRVISSDDADENTYLFNTGASDWVNAEINMDRILDRSSLRITAQFGTEYLFFKSQRAPWNNPVLRNALTAAVPWDQLREQNFVPAETFILPVDGYPDVTGLAEENLDDAMLLLESAGYTAKANASGQMIAASPSGERLSLVFAIPDLSYMVNQAQILVTAWSRLGVEVIVQKTPLNRYLESIRNWNADLFTYTWIGDFFDPLAFLELFRGGSSLSESYWDSTQFDALLAEAALLTDSTERYKKLAQAEQVLLDAGVILPVSHPVAVNIIDTATVQGWYDNALDIHPFKYLYFAAPAFYQDIVSAGSPVLAADRK